MSGLALDGVRVLAVEQFGAGPWATLQLADLGADVIKIEDPGSGGDVGRYVPPAQVGEDSLYFEAFNRGKRSVSLDLRSERGRAAFARLVAQSDAVFSNLRGDVAETLGLTYDALKAHNPRIVCCSLSGFGMTGPRRAQGAYDHTIQGLAGWQAITGAPDDEPTKSGLSLVDFCGGLTAAIAMLAGILHAREHGVGCDADLSLFEVALAQLNYLGTWSASREIATARRARGAHASIVPFQNFRTRDGWIVIACPKEHFFRRLCGALDLPQLLDDPRYADFAARGEHREPLVAAIERRLLERPTAAWIELLEAAGVPCGPVNDVAAALRDEQARARGVVGAIEHPTLGTVGHVKSPLRLSSGTAPLRPAPRRGEHTDAVLAELGGLRDDELAALRASGVRG
ncbi:CoA transferase [Conexibacter arvalis]|uniref:Crotonobetainyl-CoA:carnitine CoA-transferase CaiB-like acyl-CoA transferase n=1 Tax=Conexibacter arvalis TaxID=912552 RepID=A0A840IF61_9ACTN|nr:crotonobetainyl-CoA:carnitine CoA-transferase CaiB-like acyl-CoA transferase [Conexibacter arvalis]